MVKILYGETLDFQSSISNGNIKCPIGKLIFTVNLPLKLYCATVANVNPGSQKNLQALFYMYLHHMLAKFEQNFTVQNVQVLSCLTNTEIFKNVLA